MTKSGNYLSTEMETTLSTEMETTRQLIGKLYRRGYVDFLLRIYYLDSLLRTYYLDIYLDSIQKKMLFFRCLAVLSNKITFQILHLNSDHKLPLRQYIFLAIAKQMLTSAEQIQAIIKYCTERENMNELLKEIHRKLDLIILILKDTGGKNGKN